MFAIIDIETTGGSSSREKITEICIVLHDGLQVTEHFTTLIDPERPIPYHITRLTGITNEMVSTAPKFYEVAKKIVEMTEDRIFVAHNVNFDYGFIREEFRSLGFNFARKKLCTVRLGRKLLPGHRSYSLGKLCNDLGIVIEARHRAEGDAFATTKLFELLLKKDNSGQINLSKEIDSMFAKMRSPASEKLVKDLPEQTGVYYFHDSEGHIIYIGKSVNIKNRVINHLSNISSKKAITMANAIQDVSYELTGSELVALLLESHEIKKHKPVFNRSQVRSVFSYGVSARYDELGYLRMDVSKTTSKADPFISFVNMEEARNFMFAMVEEHELCQKLSGLDNSEGACFNYRVKKCSGACLGHEDAGAYNKRAMAAINDYRFESDNFFLLDKGRSEQERAVVKVEKGKYCGFGYLNEEEGLRSVDELHHVIKPFPDNRDVRHILRHYIASEKAERIIKF
ncbi:MAG TPA: exonuclease domain-containing protein [Bacteroidia bacterium]